jgi:hypothetical protein
MTDYIKRSDIADRIDYYLSHSVGGEHYAYEICAKEIQDAPTADVEEIKHGSWEKVITRRFHDDGTSWSEINLKCSACGYLRRFEWKPYPSRCEDCGAKMYKEN